MSASTSAPSKEEMAAKQQAAVIDYVASRGIAGAWFEGSTLKAHGDVPLREITEDAGINWGGGGHGGKMAYSQVRVEEFVHPEERARHMLAECIVSVATTGKLPEHNERHKIRINEDGDLVTTTGHIAMKRNVEIEKLLPLFEKSFAESYEKAMGHEFPDAHHFKTKSSPRP